MKTISAALKAHIAQETTTLAHIWLATMTNGTVLGFTDHDSDIHFNGINYGASAGFIASNIDTTFALNVDNLEVTGPLSAPAIIEVDTVCGLWDGAVVVLSQVNYNDLTMGSMYLRSGTVGIIKTGRTSFTAEIRGMMQPLQQNLLEYYSPSCRAILGDARCKVNIAPATYANLLLNFNGTNGSTVFADSSPVPKTCTGFGTAVISTAQSKFGGSSAYFDGSTGCYVQVQSSPDFAFGANDWTWETFFYKVANPSAIGRLYNGGNGDNFDALDTVIDSAGNWAIYSSSTGSGWNVVAASSVAALNNGQWYHLAITRQGGTIRAFVDGVMTVLTTSAGSTSLFTNGTPQNIGGQPNTAGRTLNGYLDSYKITNGGAAYTANFTPPVVEPTSAAISSAFVSSGSVTGTISQKSWNDTSLTQTTAVRQSAIANAAGWVPPAYPALPILPLLAGITNGNPALVNSIGHGFVSGDQVSFSGVTGMTQINGMTGTVSYVDANRFNVNIDTSLLSLVYPPYWAATAFSMYTGGGVATLVPKSEFFQNGLVTWTSGLNKGLTTEVKLYYIGYVELFQPMPYLIQVGDTYTISAGCDKQIQTCSGRFNNVANFRGEPFLPGNDALLRHG